MSLRANEILTAVIHGARKEEPSPEGEPSPERELSPEREPSPEEERSPELEVLGGRAALEVLCTEVRLAACVDVRAGG